MDGGTAERMSGSEKTEENEERETSLTAPWVSQQQHQSQLRDSVESDTAIASLSSALAHALQEEKQSDFASSCSQPVQYPQVLRSRSTPNLIDATDAGASTTFPSSSAALMRSESHSAASDGASLAESIAMLPQSAPLSEQCLVSLSPRGCASAMKELARRKLPERAEELFQLVRISYVNPSLRCTFVYNAAIALLSDGGRSKHSSLEGGWKRGLDLLEEMRSLQLSPSVHTYTSLMHALMRGWKLEQVLKLFERMRSENLSPNVITYSTLISAYGKLGRWEDVLSTLQQMNEEGVKPNLWTYNNVMFALNSSQQWSRTLQVYEWLAQEDVHMNTFSYNAVLNACSQLNAFRRAMAVASEMRQNNVPRDEFTYGALMAVSERTGHWQQAMELLEEAHQAPSCTISTVMCNTAISACVQAGEWQRALSVQEWMASARCKPDIVTHTVMLGALNQGGMWHPALALALEIASDSSKVDRIFALKALDVLFSSGITRLQKRALSLLVHFQQINLLHQLPGLVHGSHLREQKYKSSQTDERTGIELSLAGLSFGAAFMSIYIWLREAECAACQLDVSLLPFSHVSVFCYNTGSATTNKHGHAAASTATAFLSAGLTALDISSEHVDGGEQVTTSPADHLKHQNSTLVQSQSAAYKAMLEMSKHPGFPFQPMEERNPPSNSDEQRRYGVRFVASVTELLDWLGKGRLNSFLSHLRHRDDISQTMSEQPGAFEWTDEDSKSQALDDKARKQSHSQMEALLPDARSRHKGMNGMTALALSAGAKPFQPTCCSKAACDAPIYGGTTASRHRCATVQKLARLLLAVQASDPVSCLPVGADEFHDAVLVMDVTWNDSELDATFHAATSLHIAFQQHGAVGYNNAVHEHMVSELAHAAGIGVKELSGLSNALRSKTETSLEHLVTVYDVRNVLWTRLGGLPEGLVDICNAWSKQVFEPCQHTAKSIVHDVVYNASLLCKHTLVGLASGVVCTERAMLGMFPVWPACLEELTGFKATSSAELAASIASVHRFAFGDFAT